MLEQAALLPILKIRHAVQSKQKATAIAIATATAIATKNKLLQQKTNYYNKKQITDSKSAHTTQEETHCWGRWSTAK